MDLTILASFIQASATIFVGLVSAFVAIYVYRKREAKLLPVAVPDRRDAIYGYWKGKADQETGSEEMKGKHDIEIKLFKGKYSPKGHLKITLTNGEKVEGPLINTIFDGYVLKTDYINKSSNTIHFGSIYAKLSGKGNELNGKFLGYGLISDDFVNGGIAANKVE